MEFLVTHFWAVELALLVLTIIFVLLRLSAFLTMPWWVMWAPAIVGLVLMFVYGLVWLLVNGGG